MVGINVHNWNSWKWKHSGSRWLGTVNNHFALGNFGESYQPPAIVAIQKIQRGRSEAVPDRWCRPCPSIGGPQREISSFGWVPLGAHRCGRCRKTYLSWGKMPKCQRTKECQNAKECTPRTEFHSMISSEEQSQLWRTHSTLGACFTARRPALLSKLITSQKRSLSRAATIVYNQHAIHQLQSCFISTVIQEIDSATVLVDAMAIPHIRIMKGTCLLQPWSSIVVHATKQHVVHQRFMV